MRFHDYSSGSRAQRAIDRFATQLKPVLWLLALAAAVPMAGNVIREFGHDGLTLLDILIGVLLAAGMFAANVTVQHVGLFGLPRARLSVREQLVPMFVVVAVLVASINFLSGLLYVGRPSAEAAHQVRIVQTIDEDMDASSKAYERVLAADDSLAAAEARAEAFMKAERSTGAICQRGGLAGPCTSILEGLYESMSAYRRALVEAREQADPLLAEIRALYAQIDTIDRSQRRTITERSAEIEGVSQRIVAALERFRTLVPLAVLESARAEFSKPWASIGMSDIGAARLQGEFAPVARQLGDDIAATNAVLAEPLTDATDKSPLQIISEEWESIILIGAVMFLIESAPIFFMLLIVVWSIHEDRQDEFAASDDGDSGSSPPIALPSPSGGPRGDAGAAVLQASRHRRSRRLRTSSSIASGEDY